MLIAPNVIFKTCSHFSTISPELPAEKYWGNEFSAITFIIIIIMILPPGSVYNEYVLREVMPCNTHSTFWETCGKLAQGNEDDWGDKLGLAVLCQAQVKLC